MMQTVTIELDAFHAAELEALAKRMGATPGQVVALALDQFGHELRDYTPEQIAMIEQGLAKIARGEAVSYEDVVRDSVRIVGRGAPEEETGVIFAHVDLGPLTPEDVKAIELGKRQARSGETISHEEMKAELNELLR